MNEIYNQLFVKDTDSDSVHLEWVPTACLCNKFPGVAVAADPSCAH